MIRRILSCFIPVLLLFLFACEPKNNFEGYLWFGQKEHVAVFDFTQKKLSFPKALSACVEAAAGPLGQNFAFICTSGKKGVMRSFETGQARPVDTTAILEDNLSDPALSPDGTRTLFRVQKSGDVYDSYLLFKGSRYGKLLKRIGAVTFGPDNQTIYVAQGDKLAMHVIDNIIHPSKLPPGGLRAIYGGSRTIRDIDFHLGLRKIAFCEGTQVIVTGVTGEKKQVVFDASTDEFSGALRLPYRVRWAPKGDSIAVMVSTDGKEGTFVVVDPSSLRTQRMANITANVGSFAWTSTHPTDLK